jgi:hypothetical protein
MSTATTEWSHGERERCNNTRVQRHRADRLGRIQHVSDEKGTSEAARSCRERLSAVTSELIDAVAKLNSLDQDENAYEYGVEAQRAAAIARQADALLSRDTAYGPGEKCG